MKIHNFSAGPSILPRSVIEQASNGILNINNSNLSLIEISHRSKDFVEIMDRATTLSLDLLNLNNKGYKALFLQGGASMQFLMTAYNLLENKAGYINTGAWSTKALKEAKNFGNAIEVATSKDANFNYIPKNYYFRFRFGLLAHHYQQYNFRHSISRHSKNQYKFDM